MNQNKISIVENFNQINKSLLSYPTTILYMNIRSLRLNFTPLLASLHSIIKYINFIVLVETNITNDEQHAFNIPGFNSYFSNRIGRGGGVAVYIREHLMHTFVDINTISFESMLINVTNKHNSFSLFIIYRPPKNNVNEFVIELDKTINTVKNKQDIIIIGDMNINILNQNITTTKYKEMISSNGLHCVINEITREDLIKRSSSCIDHMHVRHNKINTQTYATVIKSNISDHYAIFCCTKNEREEQNVNQGTKTIHRQGADLNSFKISKNIKTVNWSNLVNQNMSTNEIFKIINETFKNIYENSKSLYNSNKKHRKVNPWMNEDLIRYCKIRDKLYNKWLNNKNNTNYENDYKKYRNFLNKKLIFAKNNYFKNKFIENRNNIRATWQLINELTGKKTTNIDISLLNAFKNDDFSNIANKFATNFDSNVKKIIHICDIKTFTNPTTTTLQNSMFLLPTTESEVCCILGTLKTNKGAGADGIRPKDLKHNCLFLTRAVTTFINSSINNATIPNILKTSLIRPIYKSGPKNDCNNYRPIAILPVIEKVLEEIIVRRLNEFLTKFKIINPNQYGFQKGKNINQLLGNFSNYINTQLGKHQHCLVLFIDFSKAFDTLSHSNLLNKLERTGVRGNCLEWFRNYLNSRTYKVKICQTLSDETNIDNGVPQGSKLGPILYLIYSNEMLNMLKDCTTFAYADDTAVIVSDKNINIAYETMQKQLNRITKWCHDNGLVINASKTKIMHIKPPHLTNGERNIIFHNNQCLHNSSNPGYRDACTTTIELVKSYKYLGVFVDENFKWLTHVQYLSKKLRKAAYSLYHLSNCSTYDVLKQAYFSLAESYIRHGITAWGNSTYCRSLQQTQNQILKILLKNKLHHNNIFQIASVYENTNNTPEYLPDIETVTNNVRNITVTNNNNTMYSNTYAANINITTNNITNNSNNASINTNTTNTSNSNINNTRNTNNNSYNISTNINNIQHPSINNINNINNTHNVVNITNNTSINILNNNLHSNTTNNINSPNMDTEYVYSRNITSNKSIASNLQILNIKSLYYSTLANEFYNDHRFLQPIDHAYNTRQRADGRYKVERHINNYGKNSLYTTLPNIFNKIPIHLLNITNPHKRRYCLKNYFIASQ